MRRPRELIHRRELLEPITPCDQYRCIARERLGLARDAHNHRHLGFCEFARLRLGPVVRRDELEYFSELLLLDPLRVTLACAGLSPDLSRFRLRNEFFRADGQMSARVISHGGWLDLAARKLTAPPPDLARCMEEMPRTDDFAEIS